MLAAWDTLAGRGSVGPARPQPLLRLSEALGPEEEAVLGEGNGCMCKLLPGAAPRAGELAGERGAVRDSQNRGNKSRTGKPKCRLGFQRVRNRALVLNLCWGLSTWVNEELCTT